MWSQMIAKHLKLLMTHPLHVFSSSSIFYIPFPFHELPEPSYSEFRWCLAPGTVGNLQPASLEEVQCLFWVVLSCLQMELCLFPEFVGISLNSFFPPNDEVPCAMAATQSQNMTVSSAYLTAGQVLSTYTSSHCSQSSIWTASLCSRICAGVAEQFSQAQLQTFLISSSQTDLRFDLTVPASCHFFTFWTEEMESWKHFVIFLMPSSAAWSFSISGTSGCWSMGQD